MDNATISATPVDKNSKKDTSAKNEGMIENTPASSGSSNNKAIIIVLIVVGVLFLCCGCSAASYAMFAVSSDEVSQSVSDEYDRASEESEEMKKSVEEKVSNKEELKKDTEVTDGLDALEQYLTEQYGLQIYPGTEENFFIDASDETEAFLTFNGVVPNGVEADVIAHYDRELSFISWDSYEEDDSRGRTFYAENDDIFLIISAEGSNPTMTTITVSFK